jgi:hypothetical protein
MELEAPEVVTADGLKPCTASQSLGVAFPGDWKR